MINETERSPSLRWHYANRDKARERMTGRRRNHRDRLAAIKLTYGCLDCGYAEHSEALDFDHRPGEVKLFDISEVAGRKWSLLMAEVDKCDVVCANCHRVRTADRRLCQVPSVMENDNDA